MTTGTGNAQLELARGGDAPAPRTLFDVLSATAATHPDATALEDPAGSAPADVRDPTPDSAAEGGEDQEDTP